MKVGQNGNWKVGLGEKRDGLEVMGSSRGLDGHCSFRCPCCYLFSIWLKLETLYDPQSVLPLTPTPGTVACDRNGVVREEYQRNEKNQWLMFRISLAPSETSLFSLLYYLIQENAVWPMKNCFVVFFLPFKNISFRLLIWIGRFVKVDKEGSYGQVSYMLELAELQKGFKKS